MKKQFLVLIAVAALVTSHKGILAEGTCSTLATEVRELKGAERRARIEKLTNTCFLGPWEGELRHFFPGREHPLNHFCCPKTTLEFEATKDGIRVLLMEANTSPPFEFLCMPGDEQYTCKGGVRSRHKRCTLTATPPEAEKYSEISLECTDDNDDQTLQVRVYGPEPINPLIVAIDEIDAMDVTPSKLGALLEMLPDRHVGRAAADKLIEVNNSCSVVQLVIDFQRDHLTWGPARGNADHILMSISGMRHGKLPELWQLWWDANKESSPNEPCPRPAESPQPSD